KDGIKILFQANISFDPSHGLALWITDIDPGYTLGDLEREKLETITQLKDEGIFDKNKTLKLPQLPQRIGIISVETSKGYADFLKVIETNTWKYKFFHLLFPSLLQGDKAAENIIVQLRRIKKVRSHFDVVAIIRGGGGDVGLSCYNNYLLAKEIALFPIPVITGIGHATNETVAEMISFSNAITPTKLAEYLIQKFHNFSVPVHEAEKKIIDKSTRLLSEEKTKFLSEVKLFRSVTENMLITNRNEVKNLIRTLFQHAHFVFKNENDYLRTLKTGINKGTILFFDNTKQEIRNFAATIRKDTFSQLIQFKLIVFQLKEKLLLQGKLTFKSNLLELNSLEKNIGNMSPLNVLKRGYSITLVNGKAVKSIEEINNGDTLNTTVFDGKIISNVTATNKNNDE
ncbi:MAG: exodeoxyribonuclease VII large subunit, partial [Chitinophagaceae bacterium]